MILTILFLVLFLIAAGILILFVFSVLIPSVTSSELWRPVHTYVFAESELKHSARSVFVAEDTGLRAVVCCNPSKTIEKRRFEYNGPKDCRLFNELYQTEFDCIYQCAGFGSCLQSCPQQAIRIINGTAAVSEGCVGCGRCISSCPKGLIKLIPADEAESVCLCGAENEDTCCSMYKKAERNAIPARKSFQFWQKWYNMFYRNNG